MRLQFWATTSLMKRLVLILTFIFSLNGAHVLAQEEVQSSSVIVNTARMSFESLQSEVESLSSNARALERSLSRGWRLRLSQLDNPTSAEARSEYAQYYRENYGSYVLLERMRIRLGRLSERRDNILQSEDRESIRAFRRDLRQRTQDEGNEEEALNLEAQASAGETLIAIENVAENPEG